MMFKYIIALVAVVASAMTAQARTAILAAHYGSSLDDTRAKTIDLITDDIRRAFPALEVREAYISEPVRKKLAARGVEKRSVTEALLALTADGFDTVYVQPSTIIEGNETADVRRAAETVAPFFSHIAVGTPLCYTIDDARAVAEIMAAEPCAADEAIVFVGHGNALPSTATYAMLDYMLHADGHRNHHVSTIEGYPTAATTLAEVGTARRVRLIPFLLVCGDHTRNDIAGQYAATFRDAGIEPTVVMRGFAELPAVRALIVGHLASLLSPAH